MSTKEKRDRLFKGGRPNIRPLQIFDGDRYHKDIGILWVSYSKGKFFVDIPSGLDNAGFIDALDVIMKNRELLMIDDTNEQYSGVGPIAVVSVGGDGWKIEPHVVFFPWATTRNKLRGTVSFFQMARYKKIGCCMVYSLAESRPLFDKVQKYGVLNYVGRIPNGDSRGRGDEYLFTIRGTK